MVRRRGPEEGAAAIEMAMVAPVFMALVFGILNLGWALYCGAEVRHAVERSSRMLIVDPTTTGAAIQTAVRAQLDAADSATVTVARATEAIGTSGEVARLTWTYGYTVAVPFLKPIVLDFNSSLVVPLRPDA